MFAYCGNNSPLFKDPNGMMNVAVGSTGAGKNYNSSSVPGSFASEAFSTIADMGDILSVAAIQQAMDDILSQAKPKNWTYNKFNTFIAEQKVQGEKLFSIESKISKGLSIASVGLDVGIGVYDNIMEGKSAGKIVYDAAVDITVSSTNVFVTSTFGASVGTFFCPGLGTLAGALGGFLVGNIASYITDVWQSDGNTLRGHLKDLVE